MAITFAQVYAAPRSFVTGASVDVYQDLTFDNSYPTGGYALTPANLGLSEIVYLDASSTGGYLPHYDYANQKLKLYQQSAATGALTEVANTTDLHLISARLFAIGKGFATQGLK